MAGTIWGANTATDFLVTGDAGDQFNPAVADSGGGSFGVAWTTFGQVRVRFYDVAGSIDPALGTILLSDGLYAGTAEAAVVSNVALTAGGAVGYAAVWEETSAVDPLADSVLRGRYVGLAGTVGSEFSISAEAGVNQHDASVSGYFIDGPNGKPVVDGFNVVWVSTNPVDALTAEQVADGYGRIMMQRFAVPLDAKVDPVGPPAPAGLDGNVGGASDAPVNVGNEAGLGAAVIGRDPQTIVTHDGETVVTWIGLDNNVHVHVYGATGFVLDGLVFGANVNNLGAVVGTGGVKVVDLAGSGFVVAWVGETTPGDAATTTIMGQIFAPGPVVGSYVGGAVLPLQAVPAGYAGDFSLATLIDTGGFALSWSDAGLGGDTDLFFKHFNAGGGSDNLITTINTTTLGEQANVASAALVGDRVVAVYQDDPSVAAGDMDIRASIIDTRTAGQVIVGDNVGIGAPRAIADQLVGTVGDDTLSGLAASDELHGALGDDTLIGGAGDDFLFGGGGNDTAVFSGTRANYSVQYVGGTMFSVQDLRVGPNDGVDTLVDVESLQFSDQTVTTIELISGIVPVTPTAWGWTDEDADFIPNALGAPDVDGFIVNHELANRTGVQSNVAIADSVGEFIGMVWDTVGADGNTHIRGQFYDVILAPDAFIPNAMDISDGIGIESNAVISSGGANSGWSVVWEELTDGSDVSHALRTNFVGPGQLTSVELNVLDEGNNVDQHDAAIFGSFLDRTLASPEGGSVLPTGMNEGYNVAWVSTHLDGADGVLPAGYGRIMFQRFEVPLDALGNPGAPVAGGIDGIAGLDNVYGTGDAAVWLGDEDANLIGGAFGRNPSTTALHGFESAVIWIEQDGLGGERIAGRIIDDLGQVVDVPGFDNISAGYSVAAGTNAFIVSAGAVNLGVVWVTGDETTGLTVMGNMYAPTGAGLNGVGFGFGALAPFVLKHLPLGTTAADLQLAVSSISGEDSSDLVFTWRTTGLDGSSDIMAQHVQVALDPITGFVIGMVAEGDAIQVNGVSDGNQDNAVVAGLLGDRFITAWHDTNADYTTDGGDIVARVIDTRDAVNPEPIIGDLLQATGAHQARRDVLIGTNGDDVIQGDFSDSVGAVDYIYAGMGDDTIQGGPGIRGAAGIPEIIDGGVGTDTAVYTGRRQDYSITVNGDGSYEVIDLRPTANAAGTPLQHDGIDNLYSIERIRFLDTAHGGASAETIVFDIPGTPPAPPAGYDGTPVAWSLDDPSLYKEVTVDVDPTPGDAADAKSGINATNLQDGAAVAWVSGTSEVWAISYDITGKPDPILLAANTQLTDGTFSANSVGDIDMAMTGGLGFTAVWESTDVAADTAIHLRFASTNTHVVADPNAGVPGPGLVGPEIVVVGSNGAGTAVDPVIQGYEIVNDANDTLEVGFHVGFVVKDGAFDANAGDAYGALTLARYEIPVYDILLGANGLPQLDANNQGQLATDAEGNFIPSTTATFGTGSETTPISIGLDGLRGTADDGAAIVLTDLGLFAANNVPANAHVIQGRDISIGSLHDGQLVVSYIDTDEQVRLKVFLPTIDQNADRETGSLGVIDVVATGVTAYSEFTLPFNTLLGTVASGQTQYIIPQQNGSFGVFWVADDAGSAAIQGIIYSGAGTNWSASPLITFETGLPLDVKFQVAPTGVTPGGLEDGFFVSWEDGTGIQGQRFDMKGAMVGSQITVGDPTTGTPGVHSVAGIDDGRMIVGYEDGGDVSVQFLDNRESGITLIGPRTGAPRDVIVGTVGDDAMDGRALDDQLFGGLGNDFISLGSGNDQGFGGAGDDQLIGGTGQDELLGEDGDDLLWGGLSGPVPGRVDRVLQDGLVTAGVNAALIASDTGADIISGGAGLDTISYQGEIGRFNVNLQTGIVTSDRTGSGNFILEDVIGAIVDDGAGGQVFQFTSDIENATGGIDNDTLTGDGRTNVLNGGAGSDILDGGAGDDFLQGGTGNDTLIGGSGIDKAVYDPAITNLTAGMFSFDGVNWIVTTGTSEGTDTLTGIEIVDGNRFVLIGGGSAFQTQAQADASGQLVNGDVILTFDAVTHVVTSTVFTQTNPNAPVAANHTAAVAEDTPLVFDVRADGYDPDGTAVAIDPNSLVATHGTASIDADGNLVFLADPNYNGQATVQYKLLDTPASGTPRLSNVATLTINVTPVQDAPTAVDDGIAATEAGVVAGADAIDNVLLNDLDPDLPADTQTVVSAGLLGGVATAVDNAPVTIAGLFGTLTIGANGDVSYHVNDADPTVNALTTGGRLTDNFVYTMRDGAGATSTANLSVTINGANDAPIVANAIADQTASAVGPFSFVVPANAFTDVDTATLALSAALSNGSPLPAGLVFNAATRTFTGTNLVAGNYDIRVTASDGLSTASDIFRLTVNPNQAPVFTSPATATIAETALNGAFVGSVLSAPDPEGTSVRFGLVNDADGRFQLVRDAAGYHLAVVDTLMLDHQANDAARSYTVQVQATDATGLSSQQTITVSVTGVPENRINGSAADNTINGTAGNDTINGLAGKDTMAGLAGNDIYFVDNSGDKVNENANQGTDSVYVSALTSYSLGNNVENLVYTGTANNTSWKGNSLNNTIIGGTGNDSIQGLDGDDRLIGGSGADTLQGGNGNDVLFGGLGADILDGGNGDDILNGGLGNDSYTVTNGNDRIVLQHLFGNDTVSGFDSAAAGGQDLIDLSAYGFTAASIGADILISGNAAQTVITIGGDTITLAGVNVTTIDGTDFIFGG